MSVSLKRVPLACSILTLAVAGLLAGPRSVQAAGTLTVTTQADEFNTSGNGSGCSLREAIFAVNHQYPFGGCVADEQTTTINLPAGTYTLSILNPSNTGEDEDLTGDLDIRSSMTITGAGAAKTRISAASNFNDRVFHVQPRSGVASINVQIAGMTITGGQATDYPIPGGAGVLNQGANLQMAGVTITQNIAQSASSAVLGGVPPVQHVPLPYIAQAASGVMYGGGLTNMKGSVLAISDSTISANTATYGGGVYSEGVLTIANTSILGNVAVEYGAGVYSNPYDPARDYTHISGSTISSNRITDTVGDGAGVVGAGSLTIQDSTIIGNMGTGLMLANGSNAKVTSTKILSNQAASSASMAGIESSGILSLKFSTVDGNAGVGLLVQNGSTVSVANSIFHANAGAGVKVDSGSTAALTNTTISANSTVDFQGGVVSAGDLTLANVTIADNVGNGLRLTGGSTKVQTTILARQAQANCTYGNGAVFVSNGYNLFDKQPAAGQCPLGKGNGDLVADPLLAGQLADNGGQTQTYAFTGPDSPAVDAIPEGDTRCLSADQRWYGRPADGNGDGKKGCDIGAYEFSAQPLAQLPVYLPIIVR